MTDFLAVGRIVGPHGIRGELKVEVMTDFPARFEPGSTLWVEGFDEPCEVVSSRTHKRFLLVHLDCFGDRTQAEPLRGLHLQVPRQQAMPLPEGEFYSDELQGLRVETVEKVELGTLVEVVWTGANDVYIVQGEFGELLLPAIAEVVQEVDLQKGRMVVQLLPGLIPELETEGLADIES